MSSARITQVPLRDPIYINGVMSSAWVSFFQRLASLDNDNGQADIIELEQLAKQLPSQAIQSQKQAEIHEIKSQVSLVPIPANQADQIIPPVAMVVSNEQCMPWLPLPIQEVILE